MALANNLLAFYKLDNANDSSGNGRTLTNNGNVSFASGKIGNAGVFDGTNNLQVTNPISEGAEYSLAGWVKFSNFDSLQYIMSFGGDMGVLYHNGVEPAEVIFTPTVGAYIGVGTPSANDWHFIYASRKANGDYAISIDNGALVTGNAGETYYGTFEIGNLLNGSMDAVGIWSRSLTESEITELYNSGTGLELEVPNLTSGLQAFYKLSDTSDSSGNNRTLTNNGNVSFASGKVGNAAVFDGSNYLTFDLPEMTDLSCSFWVKFNSIDSDISLLGNLSNDFFGAFYVSANQRIVFSRHGIAEMISTEFVPQIGEWYFISVTRSGSSFKLNINGSSSNNDSGDSASFNSGTYAISVNPNDTYASGQGVDGQIDAVGIWNRALSDAEVAELYNNGTGLEIEAPVVDLENGLQAFYKLSDTSDSSGNNRTLTNNGNVSFASGKLGNAAVFDGSNWMSAPINQTGITDYTLACWVKLGANSSGPQFLINGLTGNAWENGGITLDLQDKFPITYVNFGGDSLGYGLNSQTELATDTWYHLVGVRSNGLLKIYINGSVDCVSETTDNTPIPGGSPISLGQNADGTYGPFTGSMDAVGIWNRALSDAEVAELYNNGTGLELGTTPTLNTLTKIQGNAKFYGKVKFAG